MSDIQKKAPNNVTFRSLMTGKQNSSMEQLNLPIDTNKKQNEIELTSIRFDLKIEKPSSEKFSEFNYNQLCVRTFKEMRKIQKKPKDEISEDSSIPRLTITKKDLPIIDGNFQIEKKKVKKLLATFRQKIILSKKMDCKDGDDSNDSFDDEYTKDTEFEKSSKSKKKSTKGLNNVDFKKFQYADFSHLGKGYDESDSFIDNSDAQDVHIPKNLVPKRGGFYVNSEKIKLATIDEVKKSKKSAKMEEMSEQSEQDDSDDSEEYSDGDESETDGSDDDSSMQDEEMDEDEETESDEEGEETEKKNLIENELTSSNSESGKVTANNVLKKVKKVVEDEDMEEKNEKICEENNDFAKNKENKVKIEQNPNISKKRKNDAQSIEFNNLPDKVQAKITHSNGELNEIQVNNFKKKKIDPNEDQPKTTINNHILNEKNRPVYQALVDNKIKNESNECIDVEEECQNQLNSSNLTIDNPSINTVRNPSNLSHPSENLPNNLTENFVGIIKKFLDLYEHTINSNTEPLSSELKAILSCIYTESKRIKQQLQVFNYLSFKTGRNKDSLFRVCRRILNNQSNIASNSNGPIQSTPVVNQASKVSNFVSPNVQINHPNKQDLNLKIKTSPPLSPQFTFNNLNEDLKGKIFNLKKFYLIFKEKQEVSSFLENLEIQNMIFSVEFSVRNSKVDNVPKLRDFCVSILAKNFEMNKDHFCNRYNIIINQIRTKKNEDTLKIKINELKEEIKKEMPKNVEKYTRLLEDYNKIKSNEQNEELRKKMNPPRKKFEFTDKIRSLIQNIIQIKMNLLKTPGSSPSSQNFQKGIDNFFETELLNAWPKNWMQKNVLHSFYNKYDQQQQHKQIQHQRSMSVNQVVHKAPSSAPVTPTTSKQTANSSINISSKNGKVVRIEQHLPGSALNQIPSTKMNGPSTPKSINQTIEVMSSQSKQNVYDNVVNQHKKKIINQINTPHPEELAPNSNPSRPSKSPQNSFQIQNLINKTVLPNSPDFGQLQQNFNLLLPSYVLNSTGLTSLNKSLSNQNNK